MGWGAERMPDLNRRIGRLALPTVRLATNALYYCKQAVANYTVHYMTSLLKQDKVMHQRMEEFSMKEDASLHPPTIAADVRMSWKEALSVPQRGC